MNTNKNTNKLPTVDEVKVEKFEPMIFNKKINSKFNKILLNKTSNKIGKIKHFTPASQEWFNSIYAFNKNYVRSLPAVDKNLITLIKSYFSANIKAFNFNGLSVKFRDQLLKRYKRISFNKIFVGKGNIKHTNNKVIITIYLYNNEKKFIFNKASKFYFEKILENNNKNKVFKIKTKRVFFDLMTQVDIFKYKETLKSFYEYKYNKFILEYLSNNKWVDTKNYLFKYIVDKSILNDKFSSGIEHTIKNITSDGTNKWNESSRVLRESRRNNTILWYITNNLSSDLKNKYLDFFNKVYFKKKIEILLYKYLIEFNKGKFNKYFISHLILLVKSLYNKEVIFNIVNLSKLHFNSDMYTEAIALRLRNRKNKLYRVLKSSLNKVKIVRRKAIIFSNKNESELLINKTGNNQVAYLINTLFNLKDPLNILLLKLYYISKKRTNKILLKNTEGYSSYISSYVLKSLKHRHITGVRLEAKGRLTKRFTASRAIFKVKWKGGLKNVDTRYKGLSTVLLRGHLSSNVQSTTVNSKTRNGAFGLKGWVGSE